MKLDLTAIRNNFPLLQQTIEGSPLIYLDNAATTQLPEPVLDCIVEHYTRYNGNVHRGAHRLSQLSTAHLEQARATVAAFLGASSPASIIFTSGATASINLVALAYCRQFLQSGDEILVTDMEHHSNYLPWLRACRRYGAKLKLIPVSPDGTLSLPMIEQLLTKRSRLFAVTHVSNVLGTINPIEEIVRLCHAAGVPVLVDGAQAVREVPVNVAELDVDFYCFSGHKLLAPTGIGVLYLKQKWLDILEPVFLGGGMVQGLENHEFLLDRPPLRFEAGTPNYAGAIALGHAIGYLQEIGREDIADRERRLNAKLRSLLVSTAGVSLLPCGAAHTGCVSFVTGHAHAYDVAMLLDSMGIAIRSGHHCALPLHESLGLEGSLRVSPAFYNTEEELLRFQQALERALSLLLAGTV